MHRRTLLLTAAAAAVLPATSRAYPAEAFTPALWRDLRQDDRTVIFNYRATWSLTCQIKADLIAEALAENPAYTNLTFVDVDWDTFGPSVWTERLKVKRNSTLVALKNRKEVARIVNDPFERSMRRFLDEALSA